MTPHGKRRTPLTERMAEDMLVRNLSPRTIDSYTYHVDRFVRHFARPAETLGPEEIRQYQLHLIKDRKVGWSSFNQAVCALRFLYRFTIAREWHVKMIPFGKTSGVPLSSTTIQKTCKSAAREAGIRQRVSPHTLRHSFATGLLEAGVDLLTIGQLLGHKSFSSTLVYLHVRRPHLQSTPSPLDWLPVRQCPNWQPPGDRGKEGTPGN